MMNGVTIIWWDWVRWCKGETCNDNSLLDVLQLIITLHKWFPPPPPQTPTPSLICSHPRVTHKYPMGSCHILDLTLRWWTNTTGPGEARISDLSLQTPHWLPCFLLYKPPPHPSHRLPSPFLLLTPFRPRSTSLEKPVCAPVCLPFPLNMPALLGAPLRQRGIRLKELLRTSLWGSSPGPMADVTLVFRRTHALPSAH